MVRLMLEALASRFLGRIVSPRRGQVRKTTPYLRSTGENLPVLRQWCKGDAEGGS